MNQDDKILMFIMLVISRQTVFFFLAEVVDIWKKEKK
jgi:hypothetical protein